MRQTRGPNLAQKKAPINGPSLAASTLVEADEVVTLGERITRYGKAHKRTLAMLDYLRDLIPNNPLKDITGYVDPAIRAVSGLEGCGNYLHFREYYTVGKVRLHGASFCKIHLICPLCAIRRGAKALGAYLDRWDVIRKEDPKLKLYLLTLTVKNGEDLQERQTHLTSSLRHLMQSRHRYLGVSKRAPYTELSKALGGVYTLELTNKGNGWHPHAHMLLASYTEPSQTIISKEWENITGDSFIVDLRPIKGDLTEGFMEVFKYAVKFSDLSLEDNWKAYQVLKGKNLLNSFGIFRGVKVPENLLDEPLDNLPYWDRFYRFFDGVYQITGESPRIKV